MFIKWPAIFGQVHILYYLLCIRLSEPRYFQIITYFIIIALMIIRPDVVLLLKIGVREVKQSEWT